MTFLSKNINYSQSVYLKNKRLQPLLKIYNEFLLQQKINNNTFALNKDLTTGLSFESIIPNNNIKYFLFVTKKNNLETTKENYNILYFFPDQNNVSNDKMISNPFSDFYLEIDNRFNKEYLFEGYLYKTTNNKYNFLISDFLMLDDNVINLDFNMRFTMLNETIMDLNLYNLNNEMTINLHPIFNRENENMINIFKNNFIYKDDLCCIEIIDNFRKTRYLDKENNDPVYKLIECCNQSDVYNVYDDKTNNLQGILYIKGLIESKKIKQLFLNNESRNKKIKILCSYNKNFKKWQPILN